MATKTITIDVEAYRRLTQVRRENESLPITQGPLMACLDTSFLLAFQPCVT